LFFDWVVEEVIQFLKISYSPNFLFQLSLLGFEESSAILPRNLDIHNEGTERLKNTVELAP